MKDKEESIISKTNNVITVYCEYCTNCGYNSAFYDKSEVLKNIIDKCVLDAVKPSLKMVGNPFNPRQSAFEMWIELSKAT
eukprot:UN01876